VDSRGKALLAAETAESKLAGNVLVLDLQEHTPVTDFFVIATGGTRVQIRAITEAIEEALKEAGVSRPRTEGRDDGRWVLLDFGDVVVHVFHADERAHYDLEGLWADAPRIEVE
jgi:ribosome-associated protein